MKELVNPFLLLVVNLLDFINVVNSYCSDPSYEFEHHGNVVFSSRNYYSRETCSINIKPHQKIDHRNYITVLKFDDFSMDGEMPNCPHESKVDVYIGCKDSKHVATFCSNEIAPHDIYSMDGCITLDVYSQSYDSGFSATYRTHLRNDTFRSYSSVSNGIIISDGWPSRYVKTDDYWDIKTSSDKFMVINAMDFDLDGSSVTDCNYLSDHILVIEGCCDTVTQRKKMYCSQHGPFSISFPYSQASISMVTYADYMRSQRRGFILGYVFYTKSESLTLPSSVSSSDGFSVFGIIGLVVLGIIVLIMVIGCKIYTSNRYQRTNAELMNDRRRRVEMSILVDHDPSNGHDAQHDGSEERETEPPANNTSQNDATHENRRASLIEAPPPDYHVAVAIPPLSPSDLPRYEDL